MVGGRVSCNPGWFQTSHVAKDGLELLTFLPPAPEYWEFRCAPPYPVYAVLGIDPKVRAGQALYQVSSAAVHTELLSNRLEVSHPETRTW